MIRNLIFDWSGTLADDLQAVLDATNLIFAEYNRAPVSVQEFRAKFRLPFTEFYDEMLPEADPADLERHYERHFPPLQESIAMLPHAVGMLEFARSTGRRTFLLSTIKEEHFAEQAERLSVAHYFEHAYVRVMDKRKKIREILEERNLDPRETAFVGDMVHDVETARHGGVMSVAVLTGFDPVEKLVAARPDIIVQNLEALRRLLEEEPPRPVATVGALIRDDMDRILMIRTHKWSGLWGIPGGKIKRGETATAALCREIHEETGLKLKEIDFVFVQDCIESPEFMRPEHFLLMNYTARTSLPRVTLNEEAEEFRWVTHREAMELPLNTPTRRLLEKTRLPHDT